MINAYGIIINKYRRRGFRIQRLIGVPRLYAKDAVARAIHPPTAELAD